MGLHIRVFKPIERVTEADADDDDVRLLNEVGNTAPGSMGLAVKTGYYRCQEINVPTFHIPYSTFNWFRNGVCRMTHGKNIHEIWDDEESYIDEPFAPFLLSYDSDTSFDYATAQHLYDTFKPYQCPERNRRNPNTGEIVKVPAHMAIKFKVSQKLIEQLNEVV